MQEWDIPVYYKYWLLYVIASCNWLVSHCCYSTQQYTDLLNMAQQTGSDLTGWESTFIEAGISVASAKTYALTFSSKEITRDSLHMLNHAMLKALGIRTTSDMLAILNLTKELPLSLPSPASLTKQLWNLLTSTWRWPHWGVGRYSLCILNPANRAVWHLVCICFLIEHMVFIKLLVLSYIWNPYSWHASVLGDLMDLRQDFDTWPGKGGKEEQQLPMMQDVTITVGRTRLYTLLDCSKDSCFWFCHFTATS